MKITEVRINKFEKGNVKGFATITLENALVVSGLTIIEGKKGLFVSMPNQKGSDGKYYDTVYPLSKSGRDYINNEVLDAYNKVIEDTKTI